MTDIRQAYREALEADAAFSDELIREYGPNAGDARYDSRGTATPLLVVLCDRFMKKNDVWLQLFRGKQ